MEQTHLKPKLIIKLKPKPDPTPLADLDGLPLKQDNYRQIVNQYIMTKRLQTPERLFIAIDAELARLSGLEEDSIARISLLHEAIYKHAFM